MREYLEKNLVGGSSATQGKHPPSPGFGASIAKRKGLSYSSIQTYENNAARVQEMGWV